MMDNTISTDAKSTKILKIGIIVSCAIAVVSAIGYFLAILTGFDFTIGHFDSIPWFYLFSAGIIVSAIFSLVLAFSVRKCSAVVHEEPNLAEIVVRMIATAAGVAVAAVLIYDMVRFNRDLTPFDKLAGIFSVFIPLSFFTTAFWSERKIAALMNILATLAVNFSIFASYFDFKIPVNSPTRNVMTIVRCALLLFFVSESRLMLPSESKKFTVKFAVFTYFFAFTVPFGISLGALLGRIVLNDPADPAPSVLWLILFIAISLVSLVRMIGLSKILVQKTSDDEIIETKGE